MLLPELAGAGQEVGVAVRATEIAEGLVNVAVLLLVQAFLSVTTTVYVPADRLETVAAVAPVDQL